MKNFIPLCFAILLFACQTNEQATADNNLQLAIGTYTGSGSHGVYLANLDLQNGSLTITDSLAASNPSYLAFDETTKALFANTENAGDNPGAVESWLWNEVSKKFENKGRAASGGDHPCYVAVVPGKNFIAVANYTGGSVGIIQLNNEGLLTDSLFVHARTGSGPQTDRQEKSHVHTSIVDGKAERLWIADLGTDEVVGYKIGASGIDFADSILIKTPPGSGPRHIAFHKTLPVVYVVNELTGSIGVWQISGKTAIALEQIKTDTISPRAGSADIHLSHDGQFLYITNRGEANNITALKVLENGQLSTLQHISTGGLTPRNFMITPDDNWLLVANQNSNNIVVYRRDKQSGLLKETGNVFLLTNPVCLLPINVI